MADEDLLQDRLRAGDPRHGLVARCREGPTPFPRRRVGYAGERRRVTVRLFSRGRKP